MPLDACYSLDQTLRLLSIPSPTGYPRQVCGALVETLEGLGFSPRQLRKGGVVCPLGGEGRPLALAAHVDTLGLMVRAVKPDGRLAFTCLGGPSLQAVETENVTVITRGGQRYTGVVELRNASKHVNRELDSEKRDDTTLEILLDEEVSSREDVERLGIAVGDIVCLDPRACVTESGFIRSRFLDDKLSAGMLLTLARGVAEGTVRLSRKVTLFSPSMRRSATARPAASRRIPRTFWWSIWAAWARGFPAANSRYPSAPRIPPAPMITK